MNLFGIARDPAPIVTCSPGRTAARGLIAR
jgi:hypothetical protein